MTGPGIYCLDCAFNPGLCDTHDRAHLITRKPRPDEERAIADLVRAVRRAAAQVVAEAERERVRRGA